MTTRIEDSALLGLMRLASPALPVGGFSYSEGLESAICTGRVDDEAKVADWLSEQLHQVQARGDLAVAAQAHTAWAQPRLERLEELNDWVIQTRESRESRLQSEQMGRSLTEWLRKDPEQGGDARIVLLAGLSPAPTWPMAYALAASQTGATRRDAVLSMAFGWAENMVQAALKAVPLGQSAGQRVLARLCKEIPLAVDHALQLPDAARQAFAPLLAILSAQHEIQYSRLFRS